MKRSIGVLVSCCCCVFLYSQKITPTVLANAGAVMKNNNFSIEWTLGEIATERLSANNHVLTQGFHQTNLNIVSTNNPLIAGLNIYPNPVRDELIIENQSGKEIRFHVMSIMGQCISENHADPGIKIFDMSALPSGTYILEAIADDSKQQFTIEKIK
jgi:hypothetical protein